MSEPRAEVADKDITGYCEPWSLRAGEAIKLRASSHAGSNAELALTRLICGDPTSAGPGFQEEEVASDLPPLVELRHQPLIPGSYGSVDLDGVQVEGRVGFEVAVLATLPAEPQTLVALDIGATTLTLALRDGVPIVQAQNDSSVDIVLRAAPLAERRWYTVRVDVDLGAATLSGSVSTAPSRSPGRDLLEPVSTPVVAPLDLAGDASLPLALHRVLLGGRAIDGHDRGDFDGRLGQARMRVDDTEINWLFHQDMGGRSFADGGELNRHGVLHQLPTRAITGPTWDSSEQCWANDPDQWNAVHFHKDDLYDAGWLETASLTLPPALSSGVYCFRLRDGEQVDRVPFFVRPATDAPTADVAMLMSSATYMAYANHRMLFEGADFIGTRARLRPEHAYVRDHPELGRSMYEKHPDGSGVMFSSRRRPVLNLRPGADGWNFTPDTDINAFLHHTDVGHDVIADEDIHAEGLEALAPYRVIVTASHPEYWSTTMLDALEAWQRRGGRLMYLGGNGFYWRVAFSDAWPGAMELRRAEDGVRNWSTGDGESYHAFTGEYGGMWRRNDRPPNELVGVGFAAQGFGRATYFDVDPASRESRAAWIYSDVTIEDGRIGTSGLGGGAAGQEIDRYDTRLGSPEHAVVLASATDFGPDMVRTKEEFEASIDVGSPDPYVRGDIVFYETPDGGAVFSASSISWFGALARNGYDNDIAQMTTNVLRRFADPEPFEPPSAS